jgi:hypothetical protein
MLLLPVNEMLPLALAGHVPGRQQDRDIVERRGRSNDELALRNAQGGYVSGLARPL